ncbi:MAG: hypothetical protein Kow00127_22450 [Bacteroidales bacterium]
MQKIWLLSDLSSTAVHAHRTFLQNCKTLPWPHLKVSLIHAWHPSRAGRFQPIHIDEYLEQSVNLALNEERLALLSEFPGLMEDISLIFPKGEIHEVIEELAAEASPDLIVIGGRTKSWFAKLVSGLTTYKLWQHAPCPVLVIPEHVNRIVSKNVVCTSQLCAEPVSAAIRQVVNLIRTFGCNLYVYHAWTKEPPDISQLDEKLQQVAQGVNYEIITEENYRTTDGLTEFAQNMEAGILILSLKDENYLTHLFRINVTSRIEALLPSALLLVKPSD